MVLTEPTDQNYPQLNNQQQYTQQAFNQGYQQTQGYQQQNFNQGYVQQQPYQQNYPQSGDVYQQKYPVSTNDNSDTVMALIICIIGWFVCFPILIVNLKFISSNDSTARLLGYLSGFALVAICCCTVLSFVPLFIVMAIRLFAFTK
eukprot:gene6576-10739_t